MAYFLLYHKINHLKMGPYSPCSLRFLARAAMCLTHALKCQVNSACENIFALFCFVSFRFVFLLFFFKLTRRNYWRKNRSQVWLRCSTIITLLKFIKKGRWEVNNVTLLQRGIFEISNRNFYWMERAQAVTQIFLLTMQRKTTELYLSRISVT